jgi:AcrR family transcriptional regulator
MSMPRQKPANIPPVREVPKSTRSEVTRASIIETAEKMFAKDGIEGVSLRQIRMAIGSSNTNVVIYHFGSKEALVEAIVMERYAPLERRRGELLELAQKDGLGNDLDALMNALWQPFFELTNREGHHTYAAFMSSISRGDWRWVNRTIERSFPIGNEIADRIKQKIPSEVRRYSAERFRISFEMIAAALQYCDHFYYKKPLQSKRLFNSSIRMATAAMVTI